VLLIEMDKYDTGGLFLYEHRNDGSVWDTWHRTVDDAKDQAAFEFGTSAAAWISVPRDVADPIKFARDLKI
jgi:hypothetical protein